MSILQGWPNGVSFSMAPFMYSTKAQRIDIDETSSQYRCGEVGCQFSVGLDRRFTDPELIRALLRQHMDANH